MYRQGLREKIFQGIRRSMPGPQISSGTKVAQNSFSDFLPNIVKFSPIFSPQLGEEQKKKDLHWNLVRFFPHN